MAFIKRLRAFLHSTPTRLIVGYYFLFTVGFAVLLWLPFSLKDGADISFLDALFVSTSGLSNTGLSPITPVDTFSVPGIIILAANLQIGGLGLMMLSTAIWLLAGHKITLRERALIMTDQNQINLSGCVQLVRSVLISFLVVELIFMTILSHYYYFAGYFPDYSEAWLQGFFTTISAITNSGFDITGASLMIFKNDYFVQCMHMFLMFFGAMGFPVILDIKRYIKARRSGERFRFSVYTKMTMFTMVALWVIGIFGVYIFEYDNFLADKGLVEGFFAATFQSLSTRNAGFATFDMNEFSTPTLLMFSWLMIIGSSPNSSGGGIRTTTFAIMILAIISFARGKEYVNVYNREISTTTVYRSFMIFIVAILIVSLATLLITVTDPFSYLQVFFEVSSAFGTTGLSMGITAGLSAFAKLVLIATMFIGRIGIIAFLMTFRANNSTQTKVRYPQTEIIIG